MSKRIDLSSISNKNQKLKVKDILPSPSKEEPSNEIPKELVTPDKIGNNKKIKEVEVVEPLNKDDRAKLIKTLELYLKEFPEELERYKGKDLTKCSDKDLQEYRNYFERAVGSTNNIAWGVEMSQTALKIYEHLGTTSGLNIQGVSKVGGSEEWIKTVKALCLKYMDSSISVIEPEHKLMFMIFQTTMMSHFLNSSESNSVNVSEEVDVPNNSPETQVNLKLQELNKEFDDI